MRDTYTFLLLGGMIALGVVFILILIARQPAVEQQRRAEPASNTLRQSADLPFDSADFLQADTDTQWQQVALHVKNINDEPVGRIEYRWPLGIDVRLSDAAYVVVPQRGLRDASFCTIGPDGNPGEELAHYLGSKYRSGAQRFTLENRELQVPGGFKAAVTRRYPIFENGTLIGLAMAPQWSSSRRFVLYLPRTFRDESRFFVFALLIRCLT